MVTIPALEKRRLTRRRALGCVLGAGAAPLGGRLSLAQDAAAREPLAPRQSAERGYQRLVFHEQFQSFALRPDGVSYTSGAGVIWSNNLSFFPPAPTRLITWEAPGLLTLSSEEGAGGAVNTHLRKPEKDTNSLTFRHGYFEASMRLVGDHDAPDNWGSFWLFSADHQERSGPNSEWSEIDVFESGFFPAYSAAIHDHHFDGTRYYEEPGQAPNYSKWYRFTKEVNLRDWHRYGALWTPGRVAFYFDDMLMQETPTLPIHDEQYCSMILSVHGNGKSKAQFRWVRVFQ